MVLRKELTLLSLQFFLVDMLVHEKPVAELLWRGRCTRNRHILNDCNWCRCDKTHKYTCDARACAEVDVFGHFNDAIRDIDVGMEGHGYWRSTETACEPGVQYRRGGLLCVCTEDGSWPNPVCRDTFRVLHPIEETGDSEVTGQKCSATKLYLVGCNVCICPSSERLDPNMCTKKKCSDKDPVVNKRGKADESDDRTVEIYAECTPDHKYKMGCKTCYCLRNNRLHCGECTDEGEANEPDNFCRHVKPGQIFNRDCNLCYCDKRDFAYCTTKKCLPKHAVQSFPHNISTATDIESTDEVFDEENCTPGSSYKNDCNDCVCYLQGGQKTFGCTLRSCGRKSDLRATVQRDCVKGTVYELNCLICICDEIKGVKAQLCYANPKCTAGQSATEIRSNNLDSLHGYCEPLHVYKKDCNTCHCLSDGKTVRCTSYICEKGYLDPVAVDLVPITQNSNPCPKGLSYKIDCNYCFCLSNGNAICTTADCKKKMRT